jgi:hypothetical protein
MLFLTLALSILTRCQESTQIEKRFEKFNINKKLFFECAKTKDTVFINGNYAKYIPIDSNNFNIELRIENIVDTMDFYLSCKTSKGMIPKVLLEEDFVYFFQGSTSYRYVTLCYRIRESKTMKFTKFETAISSSSERDGCVFLYDDKLFFYDNNEEKLYTKKLTHRFLNIKYSEIFEKDKILIENENGDTLVYSLKDF